MFKTFVCAVLVVAANPIGSHPAYADDQSPIGITYVDQAISLSSSSSSSSDGIISQPSTGKSEAILDVPELDIHAKLESNVIIKIPEFNRIRFPGMQWFWSKDELEKEIFRKYCGPANVEVRQITYRSNPVTPDWVVFPLSPPHVITKPIAELRYYSTDKQQVHYTKGRVSCSQEG